MPKKSCKSFVLFGLNWIQTIWRHFIWALISIFYKVGQKWSLSEFSMSASDVMNQLPPYNIFHYALANESSLFFWKPVNFYGDSFVLLAFDNSNVNTLAALAIVVLKLWMYVGYKLYDVVEKTQQHHHLHLPSHDMIIGQLKLRVWCFHYFMIVWNKFFYFIVFYFVIIISFQFWKYCFFFHLWYGAIENNECMSFSVIFDFNDYFQIWH